MFAQHPRSELKPVDMSRADLLRGIEELDLTGVEPHVAAELRAELARIVSASEATRWVSTPPRGNINTVTDLTLVQGGGSRSLHWKYRNSGDYDLNGEANISDISVLGVHMGKGTGSPDWATASRADGDSNGEVTIADLTPLGANLFGQVSAYRILGAASAEEDLTEIGVLVVTKELLGQALQLTFEIPAGPWIMFAVEPLDSMDVAGARSNLCGAGIALAQFPGAPGSAVNDNLPQIEFPLGEKAALINTPDGLPLVGNRIGVLFTPAATVGEANALLTLLSAKVIGSDPFTNVVMLSIPQVADTAALAGVLTQARANSAIQLACSDIAGIRTPDPSEVFPLEEDHGASSLRELPPARAIVGENEFGFFFPDTSRATVKSHWGIENVRAPQAWNLRTYGQRNGTPNAALVVDEFARFTHDWYSDIDLRGGLVFKPIDPNQPPRPYETHGSQVAEVLGANWWNQQNFESITPLQPEIIARDIELGDAELIPTFMNAFEFVFAQGLAVEPTAVVVNNSWGLSKGYAKPGNAEWMDPMGDMYHEGAAEFAQEFRDNFLICNAAGYDGDATGALIPYDSVFSNAAVRHPDGHFLAVEAIDTTDKYSGSIVMAINLGGSVSAPGVEMPYTGTSFATPMVSSLISYLWALDPALTWQQVKTLVKGVDYAVPTTGGTKPRIDAYNAVMGIDKLQGNTSIQQAMVDVDDGTPDGQTRVNPLDGSSHTTIATPDGQRGDGIASMRDFRAWRDAFLDSETSLADKQLDGPALHFKRDLNMNGLIGQNPVDPPHAYAWNLPNVPTNSPETVYARYDFNGDARVDLQPALVNQAMKTDLELLADPDIWQTAEVDNYNEGVSADAADEGQTIGGSVWQPARYLLANRDGDTNAPQELKNLPDYLHSCDLHIMVDWETVPAGVEEFELMVRSELYGDGSDNNGADGIDEAFEVTFDRTTTVTHSTAMPLLVTLPCWTGNVRLQWDGGGEFAGTKSVASLKVGEDRAVTIPDLEWHVTDFGAHGPANENNDMRQQLTTVGGMPAIVGFRSFGPSDYEQYFRLAKNAAATEWEEPVTIASLSDGDYEFAEVDGRPAIAFANGNQIVYKMANDALGTSWGAGVPIWTSMWPVGASRFRLAEVAGHPAFALKVSTYEGTEEFPELVSTDIRYMRAQDPGGAAWPAEVVVSTSYFNDFLSFIEIGGTPGIGAWSGSYYQGSSPDGGAFSQAVVSDEVITDLAVVNGHPAAVTGLGIWEHTYSRANDPLGASWGTPQVLPINANVRCKLVTVGGHPVVVYQEGKALKYLRALDAQGTAWPAPIATYERADSFWVTDIDVADDHLCFVFQTTEERHLCFAIQR